MILMYLCFCNNYGGLGLCTIMMDCICVTIMVDFICNNYGGLMAKTIIIVVVIVLDFSIIDLLCY